MRKSVNQPYRNGVCRTCANCTPNVTCTMHSKNGHPLPCPAIHSCKHMREKAGAGMLNKISEKISKTKLLGKDQKKGLLKKAESVFHKL